MVMVHSAGYVIESGSVWASTTSGSMYVVGYIMSIHFIPSKSHCVLVDIRESDVAWWWKKIYCEII